MNNEDIKELHALITDWAYEKGYETKHLLAFFSQTFIGTMAMKGYDEDFFDSTVDLMKKRFRKHPERKNIPS